MSVDMWYVIHRGIVYNTNRVRLKSWTAKSEELFCEFPKKQQSL
jgi:hypothetical protein